jgi:predicted nucleotidyltransferase
MIETLIRKVAEQLDKENIPYMIIGGQAVLIYGRPRLTRDIDITLGVDTDKFSLIDKVCNQLKLRLLVEKPEDFAVKTKVLPAEEQESKIRVDFVFSFTQYEAQAIKNAKRVQVGDYPVNFASREDVIIHKMVAGRAVDEEDVKSILAKKSQTIDLEYIRKWLSEFAQIQEYSRILEQFNSLLKSK